MLARAPNRLSRWFARDGAGEPDRHQYRFERKFLCADMSVAAAADMVRLHPALFRPIHQPRQINNVYFDTPDYHRYTANLDGTSERDKIRIRWYGQRRDIADAPQLEIKTKSGHLGRKDIWPLPSVRLDEELATGSAGAASRRALWDRAETPDVVAARLAGLDPAIANSYQRRYFESVDRRFRLTLDWDMCYCRVTPRGPDFAHFWREHTVIAELKYAYDEEDAGDEIAAHLPFRLARNSKYINGMNMVFS